jgi:VWFA-related protein
VFLASLALGSIGLGSHAVEAAPQVADSQPQEAEAATESSAQEFFEVVDVEIVNIDVWVTDKQGKAVKGLTKEDFVVLRDRQPIEISNFYAVAGGRPADAAPPDVAAPAPLPEAPPVTAPPADRPDDYDPLAIAPEHRLWLVVYVDNYNIDPVERNRILPEIGHFLDRSLRKGDQAMIVSYNRSLKVRQPFTSDRLALLAAVAELKDDAGFAVIREREQMDTINRIDKARSASAALAYARTYAEEQMNSVEFTVDALERLIDSLAGLPGRKALLHVSSGVPLLPGEAMFQAVGELFDDSSAYAEIPRHDTSRSFERVNRHANAHRVVFYTLDAGGLRNMEFGAAEFGGFEHPRLRTTLDSVVPENLQSTLRLMALETGGQAIVNRNEVLPALEDVSADFRTFYSLGISSDGAASGRYHEIEVKLAERHKGMRLRHRAGYRSKNSDTRVRESLRSALLYSHQANPLDVDVQWGDPEPQGQGGRYVLPIQLRVPLRDLLLLPIGTGKHEMRLRLYVAAAGKDGQISEIDSAPMGLRLADEHLEAAMSESFVHTHKLLLSPGRKKVGIAVFDVFGSQASIVTGFVDVGADDPDPKFELDLGPTGL